MTARQVWSWVRPETRTSQGQHLGLVYTLLVVLLLWWPMAAFRPYFCLRM